VGIFNCLIFLGNYLQLKLGRGGALCRGAQLDSGMGLGMLCSSFNEQNGSLPAW